MLKISDSLKEIINKNPFLAFGFYNKIFNLSKLSELLKPFLEKKTKKEIQKTAILMNLSRLQKSNVDNFSSKMANFKINNIITNYNLCVFVFERQADIFNNLSKFYKLANKNKEFFVFTQGNKEISFIIDMKMEDDFKRLFPQKAKKVVRDVVSLGVSFDESYVEDAGLIYLLTQQLTLPGINILEIASTYTELFFFVDKNDMKSAFAVLSDLLEEVDSIK